MKKTLGAAVCALVLSVAGGPVRGMEHAAEPEAAPYGSAPADMAPTQAEEAVPPALGEGRDTKWSASRPPMPFDVMRSVQFLQDQVARGNDRAIRVQALLLRRFGRSFLEADPAVWQDPRNMRAALLFTLSGGTPDVLERLIRDDLFDDAQRPLFEGAYAYVQNDLKTAREKLATVDLSDMEPVLAAQLSLVLGQIDQTDHPKDAIAHLDQARLLAPGTLIEEAALRLEALLADGEGEHALADRLARRYFDRYADSTYAANFEARFVAICVARALGDADAAMLAMGDVVAGLPVDRQQRLFLAAARRSLVEGNLAFAQASSGRTLAIGSLSEGDQQRARLYQAASALGKADAVQSRQTLDQIDRSQLHPEDIKLLDAALSVLDTIQKPTLISEASFTPPKPEEQPSILSRARQALADASQDLKQSQP